MPEQTNSKKVFCAYCGYSGPDFIQQNTGVFKCPYCDTLWDFGFSEEEKDLLHNAQSILRRQEFVQAETAFLDIIERYPKNHEAYWGYICAKYGIKHEKDYNEKLVPTCCLDSIDSFKEDPYFKKALKYAPEEIEEQYSEDAAYIERVSKEWEEKARHEKPYDIFISFKDSDKEKGIERTKDSYDAGDLYAWLTNQGYNVFFSRISLADKIGEKYEPYIFNALQTAKVLIVFGSDPEYIQSTWVKNEWQRFCKRIARKEKKENSLIVVYQGFNPSELPTALSSMQCVDYKSNQFYDVLRNYLKSVFADADKERKEREQKEREEKEANERERERIAKEQQEEFAKQKEALDKQQEEIRKQMEQFRAENDKFRREEQERREKLEQEDKMRRERLEREEKERKAAETKEKVSGTISDIGTKVGTFIGKTVGSIGETVGRVGEEAERLKRERASVNQAKEAAAAEIAAKKAIARAEEEEAKRPERMKICQSVRFDFGAMLVSALLIELLPTVAAIAVVLFFCLYCFNTRKMLKAFDRLSAFWLLNFATITLYGVISASIKLKRLKK